LPAKDRHPDNVYLEQVDRCKIYIGLFGNDYGPEDAAGLSATEKEFDQATQRGKERLIYVKGANDTARHPKMQALISKAGTQLIRRRFGALPELTAAIYASLVEYLETSGALRTGPFDATACPNASMDDLSEERLRWFLGTAKRERQFALSENTPMLDTLQHLNLLDGGLPSHAAVLLFGKAPQRFLISSEVKCMHFHGTEVRKPIPSYQIYKGTVFELVDQAVDFVMSKIARSVGERDRSSQAPVDYELPKQVVTEAIVNAIAHRDYSSNASVQVMLFSDRLEVWNPGELPPSLTPEKLRHPHASIPRNPLLADPLFLTHYIEKAGSGTLDMIGLCKEANLPEPEFRQDAGQWVVTLRRPTGQVTAQVSEQVTGQATGQVTGQVAVQVMVACQSPQTGEAIQKLVGIKHRETFLNNYLKPLLASGWIERTIPDKPTSSLQKYKLSAKGADWLRIAIQAKDPSGANK